MPAIEYDLVIERGASYDLTLQWREQDGSNPPAGPFVDTSDYSARMRIWSAIGDSLAVVVPTVDSGIIGVHIDAITTQRLRRAASYELILYKAADPGDVIRLTEGGVRVLTDDVLHDPPDPVVVTHYDDTILSIISGGRGPAGPTGPPGPPGTGEGGGGGYRHAQQAASTVWDIEHNLGYDPAGVRVVATNGDTWLPLALTYPAAGQIARIAFPQSIAGTAWLS